MDTQRLKDILQKEGATAIVVGQNYGLDEMASALSLSLALTAQGKDVTVITTKQPLVEVSSLVGVDQVKSSFESKNGDLVVSFPYVNDEIGKVSYTLENGLLNIIVKPKDTTLSFGEKDVIFKRSGDLPSTLITVGVKRLSDLGVLFNIESLKDTTIINIDKALNNEGYGDVVITSQAASSVSEQVANLLLTLAFPMDPDIAQNLMSGIIASTTNFQSPKTSSLAFEMAGILLRNGARREALKSTVQTLAPQNARIFAQNRPTQPFGQPQRQQNQFDQAQRQSQPRQQQRPTTEFPREQKKDEAPPDWLAPKIFKGSTNVE